MLNYEMFMEKLKESILNLSGWNSENVSFVPHEESKFGEDRLEIVCIESATHVGCDSLSTTALYHEYLNGKSDNCRRIGDASTRERKKQFISCGGTDC